MERETLLEKYLQDELTETEWQEFNALLKKDPDFREEVEFQMDVKRAITADEDEYFMDMLSDFESKALEGDPKTVQIEKPETRIFPNKWIVAASVAVLTGLAYFFMVKQTANPQDLFAQNFTAYPNVSHPITRGNEGRDAKTEAFAAYAKGDYKTAIPLFTELYTSGQESYYLFYKANSLIGIDRASEAIPLLEEHLRTVDSLTDKSNWYLAMAYLQLEDTQKAKEALEKVVETKGYKAKEAKQLLDRL